MDLCLLVDWWISCKSTTRYTNFSSYILLFEIKFYVIFQVFVCPTNFGDTQKDKMNSILTNHVKEENEATRPCTMILHVVYMPQHTKKEQFLVWGSISN